MVKWKQLPLLYSCGDHFHSEVHLENFKFTECLFFFL